MKKLRCLLALLLVVALAISMASCYVISGQTMKKLQGTYKLTRYTYTPKYERKEGYTPKTYDYVNDEEYKYEDYLIITGSNTGYYAHKDAKGNSYVKEVTLSYQYSQDNSSKVEYIIFNDSLTVNKDDGFNKMGVAKNNLNYNKSSIDYTELLTKRPMRSESLSVRWEKVDGSTDLSYAKEQLGELKSYKYAAFAKRGIYELGNIQDMTTLEFIDNPYLYFYYLIDTADGITTATVCYATKEAPTEQTKKTIAFSANEDFASMTLDGVVWSLDTQFGTHYSNQTNEIETELRHVSYDTTDEALTALIESILPEEQS